MLDVELFGRKLGTQETCLTLTVNATILELIQHAEKDAHDFEMREIGIYARSKSNTAWRQVRNAARHGVPFEITAQKLANATFFENNKLNKEAAPLRAGEAPLLTAVVNLEASQMVNMLGILRSSVLLL